MNHNKSQWITMNHSSSSISIFNVNIITPTSDNEILRQIASSVYISTMNHSELQWITMIHNEPQWIPINHNESQWITMNEAQWITMNHSELEWITMNEAQWIKINHIELNWIVMFITIFYYIYFFYIKSKQCKLIKKRAQD